MEALLIITGVPWLEMKRHTHKQTLQFVELGSKVIKGVNNFFVKLFFVKKRNSKNIEYNIHKASFRLMPGT